MTVKDLSIGTAHPQEDGWTFSGFVTAFVATSAKAWQLSPWVMRLLLLTPVLIMLIGASSALFGKQAYLWITGEDGIAEN